MTVQMLDIAVGVPGWVTDLASFRRWARSDEFPESGSISYYKGYLWLDLSMETLLHNKAKGRIFFDLALLVEEEEKGQYLADRMRLTHPEVGLSTEPDGMLILDETLRRQRVQIKKGAECVEIVGAPDMVLEVVSDSSEQKDKVDLRQLYWRAGIQEYWLVDPRGEELSFEILRRRSRGYLSVRSQDGWLKSTVFGKSFRLTMKKHDLDYPIFKLESR
jgi:Uma2 family endonuclease